MNQVLPVLLQILLPTPIETPQRSALQSVSLVRTSHPTDHTIEAKATEKIIQILVLKHVFGPPGQCWEERSQSY